MSSKLTTMAMAAAGLVGSARAFDIESLMDPLMAEKLGDYLTGGEGMDMAKVLDSAARTFFNITLGTTSIITYNNALILILAISAAILIGLGLLAALAYVAFTGLVANGDTGDGLLSRETADNAARLFLTFFNSTSTVSASYALIIILGISFALLIGLTLVYFAAASLLTGSSVASYIGKRSLPDDDGLDLNWTRILQIIEAMEEQFRRAGIAEEEEECRKRTLCLLAEKKGKLTASHLKADDAHNKLYKLANELSSIYEEDYLNEPRPDQRSSYDKVVAYHGASDQGRKRGQCQTTFKKCSNAY